MDKGLIPQTIPEMGGLEIVTLNTKGYQERPRSTERLLGQMQKFIVEHYKGDDVLSLAEFQDEIQERRNKNYTIDVAVDKGTKQIVAVVAHDVVDMPKEITPQKLMPGNDQYTSIYYARSRGGGIFTTSKEYEPVLQLMVENAMHSAQQYSHSNGKTNVGLITIDSKHKRVLHNLAQKYGGGYTPVEIGVPTLRDDVVGPDYPTSNLVAIHNEKPIVIPNE